MEAIKCEAAIMAAERGSLTAAASALGYTQSGITRMINSLENELGFALFIRQKRGVKLTENGKIMLFEPRLYGEAKEIVDELLSHHAVIVNFTQMDNKAANKVVDFLNGAVYAIDGEIKRIGEQIFLCVPRDVDVAGKLAGDLNSNNSERL